jgi:polysaccharide export outer membrane protein
MRVIRSLILLLGVAIAAAGCAQQPVAYVAIPTMAATSGIDNVTYGLAQPYAGAPYAAAPYAGTPYAAAPYAGTPYAAAPYAAAPYAAARYATTPYATAPSARGLYAAAPSAGGLYATAPSATGSYATAPSATGYATASLAYAPTVAEGLTNSYAVDANGHIAMPLIGAVPARGATTDELSNRIGDKLRQGFIREPHVAVEIEAYRPFFILGEVTAPANIPTSPT